MSFFVVLCPSSGEPWDRHLYLLTNGAFSRRTHKKVGAWCDYRAAQHAMRTAVVRGAPAWRLCVREDRAAHRPDPEPSMAGVERLFDPEEPCPPTARSSGFIRPRRLTARESDAAASLMGALLAPLFKHHGG